MFLIVYLHLSHFVGHKDYSSMSVPVTFTNTIYEVFSVIPVFQDKIIEDVETFDLAIDIPSSVKHRISPGRQRKAIASIIDSTSKISLLHDSLCISFMHSSYQLPC